MKKARLELLIGVICISVFPIVVKLNLALALSASSLYLGGIGFVFKVPFFGFSTTGWLVLFTQAVICQLLAWLLISYATQHMKATRVSVSLLGQGVSASVLAGMFLDETITLQMVIGGLVLLCGIRITFFDKSLPIRKMFKIRKTKALSLSKK